MSVINRASGGHAIKPSVIEYGNFRPIIGFGLGHAEMRGISLSERGLTRRCNSFAFREYVRQVLGPTLRPGDIVICDNLGAHRDAEAQKLIEARGAQLRFLPPYSPDLNPIEAMWSKVKASLRAAKARTSESLLTAIQEALNSVSAADAQGFFRHCGYMCTIS